jgi:predicted ATPase
MPGQQPAEPGHVIRRPRARADRGGQPARTARLLTITGPGGIGKTRFAIELAHAAGTDFPDGTFFVPFEPVDDPMLVPGTIARAVGIVESGVRPPLELPIELLKGQRVLLVLDNFERLTSAAPIVADLLRAAPGSASS